MIDEAGSAAPDVDDSGLWGSPGKRDQFQRRRGGLLKPTDLGLSLRLVVYTFSQRA
jgi:hypothetical protein